MILGQKSKCSSTHYRGILQGRRRNPCIYPASSSCDTLAQSLEWVPDIDDRLLLTCSFAGRFIIKLEHEELHALELERIITKGFLIDNAETLCFFKTYYFFIHD
jgi:hypothetical protein